MSKTYKVYQTATVTFTAFIEADSEVEALLLAESDETEYEQFYGNIEYNEDYAIAD